MKTYQIIYRYTDEEKGFQEERYMHFTLPDEEDAVTYARTRLIEEYGEHHGSWMPLLAIDEIEFKRQLPELKEKLQDKYLFGHDRIMREEMKKRDEQKKKEIKDMIRNMDKSFYFEDSIYYEEKKKIEEALNETNTFSLNNIYYEDEWDGDTSEEIDIIDIRYIVEFGSVDGNHGRYTGRTKEEVHSDIDSDDYISEEMKDMLKYGYYKEFKENDYFDCEYVIDNAIHFHFVHLLHL